jgi:hypothetical protein
MKIGCQFLKEYGICMDFNKGAISYIRHGILKQHEFVTTVNSQSTSNSGKAKADFHSEPPSTTQPTRTPSADCVDLISKGSLKDYPYPSHSQTRAVVEAGRKSEDCSSVFFMFPERTLRSSGEDCSLELQGAASYLRSPGEDSSLGLYGSASDHFCKVEKVMPDAEVSEEVSSQSRGSEDLITADYFNFQVNSVRSDLPGSEPNTHPKQSLADARSLQSDDVYNIVEQVSCLDMQQRRKLSDILSKYLDFLTTKPGNSKLLKYKFQVVADKPIVSYSRPIPFSQRPAVRELINQMLSDGILEVSNSPILKPLTVVKKEGGKLRICIDARKVNQFTIPDHERAPPIQELLQKFNGANYLTSLDLSSAFHQIELAEESRKFTAFIFDSTVYQYTRVPYGFKNSLPAFIRAIKLALVD